MSYLCEGSCRGVEFIGKGLCHTLDVAVVTLEAVEKASGWINAAVQFVLTQLFRIYRYDKVVDLLRCLWGFKENSNSWNIEIFQESSVLKLLCKSIGEVSFGQVHNMKRVCTVFKFLPGL